MSPPRRVLQSTGGDPNALGGFVIVWPMKGGTWVFRFHELTFSRLLTASAHGGTVPLLVLLVVSAACARPIEHRAENSPVVDGGGVAAHPTSIETLPDMYNHVATPGEEGVLERQAPGWLHEFVESAGSAGTARPHVVLISLDTLRADHLGAWGYPRPTSPFLDALATSGVRFDLVFSHSPTTAPSHMSVFTGAFPSDHGTHIESTRPPKVFPAPPSLPTLPEIMKAAGYRTAAWTGGGQMTGKAGFDRGFDVYSENLGQLSLAGMQTVRRWFQENSDTPCFLFLHTYQIHDPYLPPSPYNTLFTSPDYRGWVIGDRKTILSSAASANHKSLARQFWRTSKSKPDPGIVKSDDLRQLIGLYDGGIRYSDDVLRSFFEALRDDGLLTNTLVIVFSDHGEEFLEHGGLLHEKLYQETLRVPLIFFWPGRLPGGVEVHVQVPLMDLAPTLLELAGIVEPPTGNATSLVPLIEKSSVQPRPVYSEGLWRHRLPDQRSYRNQNFTLYDRGRNHIELYETTRDRLEFENLSTSMPHLATSIHSEMSAFFRSRRLPSIGSPETGRILSEGEIEALRVLGYVD